MVSHSSKQICEKGTIVYQALIETVKIITANFVFLPAPLIFHTLYISVTIIAVNDNYE